MIESEIVRFLHLGILFTITIVFFISLIFPNRKAISILIVLNFCFFLVFFCIRAWLKQFFPFTDKTESFLTLALCILLFSTLYQKKLSKTEYSSLLLLSAVWTASALVFDPAIRYPSPYLITIWYPLHVPLSFMAYALWFISGMRSFFVLVGKKNTGHHSSNSFEIRLLRQGFICFTLSMIFGGIWGYFAWGAYFLWDPKVVWSVILWFHYGNLIHLDNLPKFKHWKAPLNILGFIMILITFVGTGFFTNSIHRF